MNLEGPVGPHGETEKDGGRSHVGPEALLDEGDLTGSSGRFEPPGCESPPGVLGSRAPGVPTLPFRPNLAFIVQQSPHWHWFPRWVRRREMKTRGDNTVVSPGSIFWSLGA